MEESWSQRGCMLVSREKSKALTVSQVGLSV